MLTFRSMSGRVQGELKAANKLGEILVTLRHESVDILIAQFNIGDHGEA